MVTQIREALEQKPQKLLLSAFGIGLSWGSVLMETSGLVVPPLTELEPASQPGV